MTRFLYYAEHFLQTWGFSSFCSILWPGLEDRCTAVSPAVSHHADWTLAMTP